MHHSSGQKSTGICIYCSDHRVPLWKNIKQHLILPGQHFTTIGILGGPISLANPSEIPVQFAALMEQISFAVKTFGEGMDFEFLCISHDCGFYANMLRKVVLQDKKNDVAEGCKLLEHRFNRPAKGYFYDEFLDQFPFEPIFGKTLQAA